MILLINNQSKLLPKLENFLKNNKVDYKIFTNDEKINFKKLPKIKGVILSGGPGTPEGPLDLKNNFYILKNIKVPILGICLGHEIIGYFFGAKFAKLKIKQDKIEHIYIKKNDPIFAGLKNYINLRECHNYYLTTCPKKFEILAYSNICPIEALKHKTLPIWALQSHPEDSGKDGKTILKNFLKICQK